MTATDASAALAAIRAREQAATPGPWAADPESASWDAIVAVVGEVAVVNLAGSSTGDTEEKDDAEFISHARTDVPALVAALRDAQAELASLKVQQAELAVEVGDLTRDEQAYHDRAPTAEAQVAAVLALHTPTRVWLRSTPEPSTACSICQDPWPCITAAAVDAPADVPMSPNTGHDEFVAAVEAEAARYHASACLWLPELRERIAQRIDQAWAEANDRRPRSEYREGYLDGLQHAEAVARITPLTIGVAPLDVEAPQYDRIESRGRKS